MNEAITLRDDQAQQGQPLVPPPIQGSSLRFKTNEFVSLKDDSLWEISETHPELVEAFVYAVSCVRERIDVVEQLAFIPGRSRHIALLSQTAAELDEVIPKITIALQAPDIGEDAFSLVRRLLSLEGMLRALRSFLFPHIPDIDRAIYAIEIAFQFYDSSEPFLELLYRFLETLWLYKRLGMRLHSSMIGQFSQYEEALNTTTETIGLVQSNPLDDGPEINIVAQLYGGISTIDTSLKRVGSVGKSIPVIAGVLSIQGALQAYRFCFLKCIENVIRSIPTIQTPSNFRDSNVWIKADAAHPYKSQMLEMRQQQEVLTSSVSCEGIHLPPECLCRVLLKISRENDTLSILSRAVELQIRTRPVQYDTHSILFVDVYETICFIDCVLQMIDIDESAFELVVGLLLSQLYVLIVYSWITRTV
ncbi:hypothetical protein NLI96_g10004 [Meripilus lineatus]|uniref:Uncharacterized protein n=1 Tax=Meripilus lineatus TaxID=2056292 RepID=A0AAD5UWP1_9APHY|nr:hypothetical protein NLI96_g10004 [Physisporinus lineatus]